MGICKYCGKPAGIFNKEHSECEQTFNEGVNLINKYVNDFFLNEQSIDILLQKVNEIAKKHYVSRTELILNMIYCWGESVLSISKKYFENLNSQGLSEDYKIKINAILKLSLFKKYFVLNSISKFNSADREKIGIEPYFRKVENLLNANINLSFQLLLVDNLKVRIEPKLITEDINYYKNYLFLPEKELRDILYHQLAVYINDMLKENCFSKNDEVYIANIISELDIDTEDLLINIPYYNYVKHFIIKDIGEGKFPQRVTVTNDIPFNLQKDEKVIWLSNSVELYEEQTSRHYEGGHLGMSFRITSGMYLRAGEFKGRPVETTNTNFITNGIVGYTNKHIYFFSFKKSFKIRYDKIISIIPRTNGLIIMKDGTSSKPVIFKNEDGVFVYNLITSLTKSEIAI